MKKNFFYVLSLTLCFSFSVVAQNSDIPIVSVPLNSKDNIPQGWTKSGSQPQDYIVGTNQYEGHGGKGSAFIKSAISKASGFGTLTQTVQAKNYRGERIKLSGFAKSKFVSYQAGFFMEIFDASGRRTSYDNMENRPIVGTSDWREYEIVLDVPDNAEKITFGVFLYGQGEVLIDDLKITFVDSSVPTTDIKASSEPFYPINMDFEK